MDFGRKYRLWRKSQNVSFLSTYLISEQWLLYPWQTLCIDTVVLKLKKKKFVRVFFFFNVQYAMIIGLNSQDICSNVVGTDDSSGKKK